METTPLFIQGENARVIAPDDKDFRDVLDMKEGQIGTYAMRRKFYGVQDYAMPIMDDADWDLERRCAKGCKRPLIESPGLEEVAGDYIFRTEIIENDHFENIPGVEKKRAICFIEPTDPKDVAEILIMVPGYKHTYRYFTSKANLYFLLQIAKTRNEAIAILNPPGKGVPGFNSARGVSAIPKETIHRDVAKQSFFVLNEYRGKTGKHDMDVILMGHSLGAKLARIIANALLSQQKEGLVRVRGIVQEAPFATSRVSTLTDLRYLKAISPHALKAVSHTLQNEKGCTLTVRDILRLFLNETTIENIYLSVTGLSTDSWRYFLDETLGSGDIKEFQETLKVCNDTMDPGNGGIGSSVITHGNDGIFSPRGSHEMSQANPIERPRMPHCVPALPTQDQLRELQESLGAAFHTTLKAPQTQIWPQ